jgi:hypothetical protein
MVYKNSLSKLCSGMDFNTCEHPGEMGEQTCQEIEVLVPEKVRDPMYPDRMQTRIAEYYLQSRPCCRVFFEDCLDIFPDSHLKSSNIIVKKLANS